MKVSQINNIFEYISLASTVTDCRLVMQSPDYLLEKFEKHIGDLNDFEFPLTNDKDVIVDSYVKFWIKDGNYSNLREIITPDIRDKSILCNILIFLNKANWDSKTLTSEKLELFKRYIGDPSNMKDNNKGEGLHHILKKFLHKLENGRMGNLDEFSIDLSKTKRDIIIDSILK